MYKPRGAEGVYRHEKRERLGHVALTQVVLVRLGRSGDVRSAQGPSTTCGKQPALLELKARPITGLHLVGLVPTHTKRALAAGCLQACSLFWGAPVRRLPLGV